MVERKFFSPCQYNPIMSSFSVLDLVAGGLVFAGALSYNHAIEKTIHKVLPNRDKTEDHHGLPWWGVELIHIVVVTLLIIGFFYVFGYHSTSTATVKSINVGTATSGAGSAAGTVVKGAEGMQWGPGGATGRESMAHWGGGYGWPMRY